MTNIDISKVNDTIKAATQGKGIKGFAKKLTYAIIIIAFLVGVLGAFTFVPFDMAAYVSFLPAIALFVIPLILSIGANSAVEKIKEKDVEKAVSVAREMKNEEAEENKKVDGAVG